MLVGLIGAGIQLSLTPAMQMEEASHHGLRMHYQLIDLDVSGRTAADLPMLLDAAQVMGFTGLNITYPCKQAVLPLLDVLSPQAQAMGAVNTVVFSDGRKSGHNTDGSGWRWGFERAMPGADSVARGAAGCGRRWLGRSACSDGDGRTDAMHRGCGCAEGAGTGGQSQRTLCGPSHLYCERRRSFAIRKRTDSRDTDGHGQDAGDATSSGTLAHFALGVRGLYFPMETQLLQAARAMGCAVVDGGTMAVGQAVIAFGLFTGLVADAARMEAHFRSMVAV